MYSNKRTKDLGVRILTTEAIFSFVYSDSAAIRIRGRRTCSPGHRNLTPKEGMLILDVVNGEIACVEVLDRNDVRGNC